MTITNSRANSPATAICTTKRPKVSPATPPGRDRGNPPVRLGARSKLTTAGASLSALQATGPGTPQGGGGQPRPLATKKAAAVRQSEAAVSAAAKSLPRGTADPAQGKLAASKQAGTPAQPMAGPAAPIPVVTSKQMQIIALLRRSQGATIAELMQATGWLSHSVRGALSGVLKRKLGLTVRSGTEPERGRVYRLGAGSTPVPASTPAPIAPNRASSPKRGAASGQRRPPANAPGQAG